MNSTGKKRKRANKTRVKKQYPQSNIIFFDSKINYYYAVKVLEDVLHLDYKTADNFVHLVYTEGQTIIYTDHREVCECYAEILAGKNLKVSVE